jgi:hypothetical protein
MYRKSLFVIAGLVLLSATTAHALEWGLGWSSIGSIQSGCLGTAVACAGDVNNDGYMDVIIGAPGTAYTGTYVGYAYLYYGGTSMSSTPDITFAGEGADDLFGVTVACAGDVNNDSYDDLIIGAQFNDGGGLMAGRAYLYFGGEAMDNVADLVMTGENAGDYFGHYVSTAGDVNDDGAADFIVGAVGYNGPGTGIGRAYIFYGGAFLDATPDILMDGENDYDEFGMSVASAGDVNNDGYDDVIVGAVGYPGTSQGRAYVYLGGDPMNNTADVVMTGSNAGDRFGERIAGAGDLNNDGYDDIIIGANGYPSGNNRGAVYIYYGGDPMNSGQDITLFGESDNDYFGYSVERMGDVNNDGYDDIIVGAYGHAGGGIDRGRAYVYYSSASNSLTIEKTFDGEVDNDVFALAVCGAGDVNGDGYNNALISAPYNDEGAAAGGKVYIYRPSMYVLLQPTGGETWNVGALDNIVWEGNTRADIYLSVDGGATYPYSIAHHAGGYVSNTFTLRIPHVPSHFSRVMVVQADSQPREYPKNYVVSDSLFTVQSTITLLAFNAVYCAGEVLLTWQSEPALPDIKGYNVYYSTNSLDYTKSNHELITAYEYRDAAVHSGVVTYQLSAVNGWGTEYSIGYINVNNFDSPLTIFPSIVSSRGTVVFGVPQFPGMAETEIEISLYDIVGSRIRTLVHDLYSPGYHSIMLDCQDEKGQILPPGTYFILMKTPEYSKEMKFVKID